MIRRTLVVFFVAIITLQLHCWSEMKTHFYIVNNFVTGFVCFSGNEILGHFYCSCLFCFSFLCCVCHSFNINVANDVLCSTYFFFLSL